MPTCTRKVVKTHFAQAPACFMGLKTFNWQLEGLASGRHRTYHSHHSPKIPWPSGPDDPCLGAAQIQAFALATGIMLSSAIFTTHQGTNFPKGPVALQVMANTSWFSSVFVNTTTSRSRLRVWTLVPGTTKQGRYEY